MSGGDTKIACGGPAPATARAGEAAMRVPPGPAVVSPGRLTKAGLRRVAGAAISHLSEAELRRDPAGAMLLAQAAMRGVVAEAERQRAAASR